MQALSLNKIIFLLVFSFGFGQTAYSQIDRNQLALADSLFKANRLLSAEKIYLSHLKTKPRESENIKLKLAYIAKAKNDWLKELYYLSSIQATNARPEISKRLEEIGEKQGLNGFEMSIWDQIYWLYFKFFPWILGFLLLIALYGVGILTYSVFQKKTIRGSQFSYLIIYIAFIWLFANFPGFLNYGIITKEKSYMRDFPSSAAPVERLLKKGNRINYWFTRDIWVYSLIENQQGYVKEDDFLPIN